jgi:hypothetical protein
MLGFWDGIVMPRFSRFSFEDAVTRFTQGLIELFAPFAVAEQRASGFFPAEFRASILKAATERTLLRLRYSGVERLVEPYALVFKRPQNRPIREYFYGFDLTGGRSSGPGIKSFFPESIQLLQNTDDAFTPRFPIELTNDGGSSVGTFARPFSTRRRSSGRGRSAAVGSYRVRCPVCT